MKPLKLKFGLYKDSNGNLIQIYSLFNALSIYKWIGAKVDPITGASDIDLLPDETIDEPRYADDGAPLHDNHKPLVEYIGPAHEKNLRQSYISTKKHIKEIEELLAPHIQLHIDLTNEILNRPKPSQSRSAAKGTRRRRSASKKQL